MKRKLPILMLFMTGVMIAHGQVNFFYSNLPIISIHTNGGTIVDDPKIPAAMKIIYNGPGQSNSPTDQVFDFNGTIGIEFRGSSSQMFPKKPYGIEIQDANGNGVDASLLGMPKKDDWTLNPSYDDKSLMRDALAYKLGRDQGHYASRTRFCELIINDVYQGIYTLQEKVKRDKNRVNISKLDPTTTTGDALTGGYIIKIDKTTGSGGDGWYSNFAPVGNGSHPFFQYDYPKQEDITAEQKTYIQSYVQSFEQALSADNFTDPVNGYRKYMDMQSMIDFFIMNEVSKNPDGYRLSTYLYKMKDSDGGKLHMGPIWDYNLGFGNVDYCTQGNPQGFAMYFNQICPTDGFQIPFWWERVLKDSTFKANLVSRWSALRSSRFSTDKVHAYIDSVATVFQAAGATDRNFYQWPVLGTYTWPNYYVGATYPDEVNWLKNWVTDRFTWLDENIGEIVTGIHDDPRAFSITAFPNPFAQEISVELNIAKAGTVRTELYDVTGNKIATEAEYHDQPGRYYNTFRMAQAAPGMYLVRSFYDGMARTEKVIKR